MGTSPLIGGMSGPYVEFSDGQVSIMTNAHFKKGTGDKITFETDRTLAGIDQNRFKDSLTMGYFSRLE